MARPGRETCYEVMDIILTMKHHGVGNDPFCQAWQSNKKLGFKDAQEGIKAFLEKREPKWSDS